MKRFLRYIIVSCLGGLGALAASCQSDEWDSPIDATNTYVSLSLPVEGQSASKTASSHTKAATSPESTIATADVFVFGQMEGNKTIHHDRLTVNQDKVARITLSLRHSEVIEANRYDVYVIANYQGSELSTIATLEELKKVIMTTPFKFDKGEAEEPFLMDGKKLQVTGAELINKTSPLSIELQRAVAKIMVTVNYGQSEDGLTYKPAGMIQKRMINYATKVPVLQEDTEFKLLNTGAKRGLTTMKDFTDEKGNTALCYSYPNIWKFDANSAEVDLQNESYLMLNIPVLIYDKGVNPDAQGAAPSSERLQNYYYVPIRSSKLNGENHDYVLKRNNFYNITVTVKANGSGDYTKPVELTGQIEVQPWQNKDIVVGDDGANFLEVSQEFLTMSNQSLNNSIEYFSSSNVTVKVVSGSVKYIDKFGVEKNIPAANYGYPDRSYVPTVRTENGKIVIESKELINVMKSFQIEVTNTDGSPKKIITVEQYPLEYVTSTIGWYSCKDSFKDTYEQHNTKKANSMNDEYFDSRVASKYSSSDGKSTINRYYYEKEYTYWGDIVLKHGDDIGNLTNAHMYYIHITSTPKDENNIPYRLGYPKMTADGITEGGENNKKLVSPAFMIASQLGAVRSGKFSNVNQAAEHCRQYVEVTGAEWVNGKLNTDHVVRYDDWRLPTEAELLIIKKYQNQKNSAIDKVLGGNYYWSASGKVWIGGGNEGNFLRCVRDVKN